MKLKRSQKDKIFQNQKAFTLIELLVVVSIIALLSSLVLSATNEARENAQYSKVYQDLKQLDNALNLMRNDYGDWPDENDVVDSETSNPNIQTILEDEKVTLHNYLSDIKPVNVAGVEHVYKYDNEGNIYVAEGCESSDENWHHGANIIITNDSTEFFEQLNSVFGKNEESDISTTKERCGKIRMSTDTGNIVYGLSS